MALVALVLGRAGRASWTPALQALTLVVLLVPAMNRSAAAWPQANRPSDVALQTWGAGVLDLPLPEGAAILADSEKIAPLYYLQQAEGVAARSGDHGAAGRSGLSRRVGRAACGGPACLSGALPARPGRRLSFALVWPAAGGEPRTAGIFAAHGVPAQLEFDGLRLLAYEVEEPAAIDPAATAVTLHWQAEQPDAAPRLVRRAGLIRRRAAYCRRRRAGIPPATIIRPWPGVGPRSCLIFTCCRGRLAAQCAAVGAASGPRPAFRGRKRIWPGRR